jgi:hypothetical protein
MEDPIICCGERPALLETAEYTRIKCSKCCRQVFFGHSAKNWREWRECAIEMWNQGDCK